jgi:pimeloyl-ACP methyl ester carboxylesterase
VQPDALDEADIEVFVSVVREPARTEAAVHLYRTFLLHEARPYLAGANNGRRLRTPTLAIHGTKDPAMDSNRLGDWERWADEMALELRDDSAHFIAEELPGLVAQRALALFAGASPAEAISA